VVGLIALLFGIIGMTPIGFFAFLGLMAWSLVVSVLAYRRGASSTGATV
jgi:hypothetical protein